MAEKDLTEKLLEDYNDVFSDIFNVLVFKGKREISEYDLETAQVASQYKADDNKIHQLERDVLKHWKSKNVRLALLGMENQTVDEKNMPFRVIAYDGAAYRSQLLSGKEKIVPVVTIVLYFGTEHEWKPEKSLKALLDIPKGLEDYVNDYPIHVFNIAWLEPEVISQFQSDFRLVAEFFRDKRLKRTDVMEDKTRLRHVDAILKLLAAFTKEQEYSAFVNSRTGDEYSMCEIAQGLIDQGRNEGRREGRREGWRDGRNEGRSEGILQGQKAIIKKMLENGSTIETIASMLRIPALQVLEMVK